jgi:hypothetical protein
MLSVLLFLGYFGGCLFLSLLYIVTNLGLVLVVFCEIPFVLLCSCVVYCEGPFRFASVTFLCFVSVVYFSVMLPVPYW